MVRTRFAPSPTGFLHIGGVRTALFNWLFARKHGGQFILRIDDTDQQRNVKEALAPILHGFRWLGIDWDEGPEVGGPYKPYYQSQRTQQYQQAVDKLIEADLAYYDYASTEEVQAERTAAEKGKHPFVYSRKWMATDQSQREEFEAQGRTSIVRLKMPREGSLVLKDLVRGEVEFQWAREQDHVIQRADKTFIYHLASVVDDHDFEITHVIRAEEHLSNTPRQVFIAQGLGYELPEYAHLPFVAEPGSKNKLSKRKLEKYLKNRDFSKLNEHGQQIADAIGLAHSAETFNPVIVDFYEQVGYLPEALINYLALLGWSLDDKTEEFTTDDLIKLFSLERVNKAPASFDPAKLSSFQDRYMQRLEMKKKVAMVLPYLQKAGFISTPPDCDVGAKLQQVLLAAGDRIKVAGDILNFSDFFTATNDLTFDQKVFNKRIRNAEGATELLTEYKQALQSIEPFDIETLDKHLHQFMESKEIKIGQIIHALRVAVTGKAKGFGMFETLAILGRDESIARIDHALAQL